MPFSLRKITVPLGAVISAALLASISGSTFADESFQLSGKGEPILLAQTQTKENRDGRQETRDDVQDTRQDDRQGDRDGREDCREQEGVAGADKRDCKQDEVHN